MIWGLRRAVPCQACITIKNDVCVVAHVDDFLSCGPKESLLKLKEQLLERFSCSGDIHGDGEDEVKMKCPSWA